MEGKTDRAGLLKAGALARAAGVSITTVKYYVKEGLVQPACKTGPNMAYYSPDCVERIRLIKSLQKDRFYPLSVIRSLLESGMGNTHEVELLNAIHKVDYRSSSETWSAAEAARQSGLTRPQIARLTEAGLLRPETEKGRPRYTESDVRILLLARQRLDAGIPLEQTLQAFGAYDAALLDAIGRDIDSLILASFLGRPLSTDAAIRLIQVSDETLDSYVALRRPALNREYGSRQLETLEGFTAALQSALRGLEELLERYALDGEAKALRRAETDPPQGDDAAAVAARLYARSLHRGGALIDRLAACGEARSWFMDPAAASGAGAESRLAACALRCCWLTLAPPLLNCGAAAEAAWEPLGRAARVCCGTGAEGFLASLRALLEVGKTA